MARSPWAYPLTHFLGVLTQLGSGRCIGVNADCVAPRPALPGRESLSRLGLALPFLGVNLLLRDRRYDFSGSRIEDVD